MGGWHTACLVMLESRVRLRRNLLDIVHGFAIPMIAFLLPWRTAFAVYRQLARLPLFSQRVAMMLDGVRRVRALPPGEARALARRHRLYLLLETGDVAVAGSRGPGWMQQHLRRIGAFPGTQAGAYVAIFFHYGTGLWGMRAMSAEGRPAHMILRPVAAESVHGRPFLRRYGEWRTAVAERAGLAPVIFWGGARQKIRDALDRGDAVLGMIDVPPTETHSLSEVNLLGHPTQLTHGLVEIAAAAEVPVVVFFAGLSDDGRERVLEVSEPIKVAGRPLPEVMQQLTDHLDRRLQRDPACWYLWGWLDAFFGPDFPTPPEGAANT